MCLLTTKIIKKFGYIILITISYGGLFLFLIAHLYPSIYTLLPGYLLLGATLGPAWISKWNLVVFFASRISCGQHECSNTNSTVDGVVVDDPKSVCNRDERIRRLARWFHAAENFGIVIGAILASVIMTCAANDVRCIYATNRPLLNRDPNYAAHSNQIKQFQNLTTEISIDEGGTLPIKVLASSTTTVSSKSFDKNNASNYDHIHQQHRDYYGNYETTYVESSTINQIDQQELLVDTMFNTNEQGERICGADLCPVWIYYTEINYTTSASSSSSSTSSSSSINSVHANSNITPTTLNATINGTMPLIIVYAIFSIIALILSCLSQRIDNNFKSVGSAGGGNSGGAALDPIKSITDTLMLAGPMSYFIGTEQAYVLADFTKVNKTILYDFVIVWEFLFFYWKVDYTCIIYMTYKFNIRSRYLSGLKNENCVSIYTSRVLSIQHFHLQLEYGIQIHHKIIESCLFILLKSGSDFLRFYLSIFFLFFF